MENRYYLLIAAVSIIIFILILILAIVLPEPYNVAMWFTLIGLAIALILAYILAIFGEFAELIRDLVVFFRKKKKYKCPYCYNKMETKRKFCTECGREIP